MVPEFNLTITPEEFFQEHVSTAIAKQRLKVDDGVQFYLVNLLCDFIDPSKYLSSDEENVLDTPLAFLLKNALEAPANQQLKIFKRLGDTSLYMAGFFQEFFNQKAFDITYFINHGQNAYDKLAVIFKDRYGDHQFTIIYNELARNFEDLVEVVAEVSEMPGIARPNNLLNLYDRWQQTGSERIRQKLEKEGILTVPGDKRDKKVQ